MIRYSGTVITYDLFNEDLFVEQSRMITNEKGQAQQVISDILGFTPEESSMKSIGSSV